jgi:hypothetical protein
MAVAPQFHGIAVGVLLGVAPVGKFAEGMDGGAGSWAKAGRAAPVERSARKQLSRRNRLPSIRSEFVAGRETGMRKRFS